MLCSLGEDGEKNGNKEKSSPVLNLNNVFQKSLDLAQAATTPLFSCSQPWNYTGTGAASQLQVQF